MKKEILKFLLGEGSFEGVWFGDKHPTKHGMFWLRKILRQEFEQSQPNSDNTLLAVSVLTPNYLREIEERIIWRLQTEFKDKNDLVQQIVADNFESLHNCLAVSGWQEVANIKKLKRGDIVRNKNSQNSYVVSANYGDRVTAICSVDITNAQEWEVLKSWAIKNEG